MIILGIDPGSHVTGFGVIEMNGSAETILDFGVIRTKGAPSHQMRLKRIYECICELIEQHHPDVCAVEMPVHGNNVQSMLKLGRAQASVMLAALNRQIPVSEYSPKQVKKAVTGNGNASKEQVRYMVQSILSIDGESLQLDATDAIAVGLCHAHRDSVSGSNQHRDWASFVRENPGRVQD